MSPRGTSNSNSRGSSYARRKRKQWLLDEFGDGTTAPCSFCGCELTFETLTVDRFPIPGCEGGTYSRGNIQPACGADNSRDGAAIGAKRRAARLSDSTLLMVPSE